MEPLTLPPTDAWHDWLSGRVDGLLDTARGLLDSLKDGTARTTDDVLTLWNDADIALRGAGSAAGLLSEVHPDAAVRTQAEDLTQQVSRTLTERGLDRELFAVLADTDPSRARRRGDPRARRRAARLSAAAESTSRTRHASGCGRSASASPCSTRTLSRTIREDVRSIRLPLAELDGLPQDWIDDHPVDAEGMVTVTTDYPDIIPFRTFAHSATAAPRDHRRQPRARVAGQRGSAARDLRTAARVRHAARLRRLAELRRGREDGRLVQGDRRLHRQLAAAADESGIRDRDVLLRRRRQDEPDAETIDASCTAYYSELVRRETYDVDAQEVRRYFDFDRVRQGLLDVTGELFGLRYVEIEDARYGTRT